MTTTINGIELETLAQAQHSDAAAIEVLKAHIAELEAHPSVDNTNVDALKAEIAALKADDAQDDAKLEAQAAKIDALAAALAALHPVGAEDIVQQLIAAIAKGITVTTTGGTGGTGGNTGGTGTGGGTPVPTPDPTPIPADKNAYPFAWTPVAKPGATVERGEGPDSFSGRFALNQTPAEFDLVVAKADGTSQKIANNFEISGAFGLGQEFTFNGSFGKRPKFKLVGSGDKGLTDIYVVSLHYNGGGEALTYYVFGDYDSRSDVYVMDAEGTYNSEWRQEMLFGPYVEPDPASLPPPPPVVVPVTGATINGTPHAAAKMADLVAATPAGGTLYVPPLTVHESVGNNSPMTFLSDGKVTNPGSKDASFAGGAILDGTGIAQGSMVENQGGFVLKADATIKGWEVKGWGWTFAAHDGTGGIRPNRDLTLRIEDGFVNTNQMGIGPHPGGTIRVKNTLFKNNGLPKENTGSAHNIYTYADYFFGEGGITSIAEPGSGDGHAFKLAAKNIELHGKNYGCSWNTSVLDMPHGTETPFIIKGDATGGTTLEKLEGDPNTVIGGYCPESKNNGTAGGTYSDLTIVIPDDGRNYIWLCGAGEVTFDSSCKFLYNNGKPVRPGGIVAQGTNVGTGIVKGLPA